MCKLHGKLQVFGGKRVDDVACLGQRCDEHRTAVHTQCGTGSIGAMGW